MRAVKSLRLFGFSCCQLQWLKSETRPTDLPQIYADRR